MLIKITDKIEYIKYKNWKLHYIEYLKFNKNKIQEKNLKNLWKWLNDKNHTSNLIIAINDKKEILGHIHYKISPNPVRGKDIGFLDDIFIIPEYRNLGIAKKLINHLKKIGKRKKWDIIRWHCDIENEIAIKYYLKFSNKKNWYTFELKV